MTFYRQLGRGLEANYLHFGDDPHHYPDPGVRSGSRSGSGKNCHNSIMLAFGGGLCSLSTSSFNLKISAIVITSAIFVSCLLFLVQFQLQLTKVRNKHSSQTKLFSIHVVKFNRYLSKQQALFPPITIISLKILRIIETE